MPPFPCKFPALSSIHQKALAPLDMIQAKKPTSCAPRRQSSHQRRLRIHAPIITKVNGNRASLLPMEECPHHTPPSPPPRRQLQHIRLLSSHPNTPYFGLGPPRRDSKLFLYKYHTCNYFVFHKVLECPVRQAGRQAGRPLPGKLPKLWSMPNKPWRLSI